MNNTTVSLMLNINQIHIIQYLLSYYPIILLSYNNVLGQT